MLRGLSVSKNQTSTVVGEKTGSMRPERFSNTDAPLNVGSAIAAVQILPENGVYVTMHGVVRQAHMAARDESGQFI